jgi:hypothetical protein
MGARMKAPMVTLEVKMVEWTNLAILVTTGDDEEAVWLPLSQVDAVPPCYGGWHEITIPEWIALDRGLI